MYWRLPHKEYEKGKGEGNKEKLKTLVDEGDITGILAYEDNKPVGWCSFGERKSFIRFEKSKILRPVDNREVLAVVCFFIKKEFRGRGVSLRLLEQVKKYASENNFGIVEGYPVDSSKGKIAAPFVWTGIHSTFLKAGFIEVARRSVTRPVMRYDIH